MSVTVLNTDSGLSGKTLANLEDTQTITGAKTFSRSTNAPFAVNAGAAAVTNLDADKLDGSHGSAFVKYAEGTITDGQLLIGKTSDNSLNRASLTAGFGMTITGGAGSITITSAEMFARLVAQLEVVSSITETTAFTSSITGGTLSTNKSLRMTAIGDFLNNTGGAVVGTMKVKYGATTLLTYSLSVASNAARRPLFFSAVLTATNATNTQVVLGEAWYGNAGDTTGGMTAPSSNRMIGSNTAAEDSTAAKNFVLTFQMDTNSASASMRLNSLLLELI